MMRSMLSFFAISTAIVAALPSTSQSPRSPVSQLSPPQKRSACSGNTADDRTAWCDYDIDTNYYDEVPDTGVTREYWLELEEITAAPDGYSRSVMAINGSVPGPTLIADWGDSMVIHVINNIASNGTTMHWHGMRQNYTNQQDGVSSITQCPQAPDTTTTYTFQATQYGTTWYHSHFSLQAWDGIFGSIIINGPATANYDEDLGTIALTDWFHDTVTSLYDSEEVNGPITPTNGLINGTNVYGDDGSTDQTGYRFNTTFESGTSYRIRLINTAMDTMWAWSIDNHTMTVIAADLVPVHPYETTVLSIGIGQRYDVIVTADQADIASDFWMRAIPQTSCSSNDQEDNIRGIIHYGDSTGTPSTTAYTPPDACDDMTPYLTPYLAIDAEGAPLYEEVEDVTLGTNTAGQARWSINSSMQVEWENPTLLQIMNNQTTFNTTQNVIQLDEANEMQYLIIETTLAVAHPIHLHGHDFFVLAQGTGTYDSSVSLNTTNPMRRDVAMLPSSGYLVLAWKTDNPGVWLMHCHIGWHAVQGLALQFIERYSEISSITDSTTLNDNCAAWDTYQTENDIVEEDDGI